MCDSCGWADELEEIEELLLDSEYGFAEDTLTGIAEWVEEKEHITEKQIAAISNIRRAVEDR